MARTMSARADARAAAAKAGIEVTELHSIDQVRAASSLFAEIWGTGSDPQVHPDLLRAMVHAGNYAAGGYADGELVGAIVGFLGHDADGPYLHSHILGVSERHRGSNVGSALKLHQRTWALDRGFGKITWTFDPLVRRNAYFNLHKLGARADAYFQNFYGDMSDGINAGDESDRLLIVWDVRGNATDHDPDELATDASVVLEPNGDAKAVEGQRVLCATPDDIVAIRRREPDVALQWRRALRETLGAAMNDGYSVAGFTRSGWYVLERDGA